MSEKIDLSKRCCCFPFPCQKVEVTLDVPSFVAILLFWMTFGPLDCICPCCHQIPPRAMIVIFQFLCVSSRFIGERKADLANKEGGGRRRGGVYDELSVIWSWWQMWKMSKFLLPPLLRSHTRAFVNVIYLIYVTSIAHEFKVTLFLLYLPS